MINWLHKEDGYCEGTFESKFFRDDENENELTVAVKSPDLCECAEKCVEEFNNLTEIEISKICKEIVNCAKESGIDEEIQLPNQGNELDILNYCWFTTLYVSGTQDCILISVYTSVPNIQNV